MMVLTKWTTSTIQWLSGQKAEIRLNETLTNYQKERYMIMNYYFKKPKKTLVYRNGSPARNLNFTIVGLLE